MKYYKRVFIILLFIAWVFIYRNFDPNEIALFPKCPFKMITGFDCPGCGSQRASHHILQVNITAAFKANPLFILSIPYVLLALIFECIKYPTNKILYLRRILFGKIAIQIILIIIFTFWIARNLI